MPTVTKQATIIQQQFVYIPGSGQYSEYSQATVSIANADHAYRPSTSDYFGRIIKLDFSGSIPSNARIDSMVLNLNVYGFQGFNKQYRVKKTYNPDSNGMTVLGPTAQLATFLSGEYSISVSLPATTYEYGDVIVGGQVSSLIIQSYNLGSGSESPSDSGFLSINGATLSITYSLPPASGTFMGSSCGAPGTPNRYNLYNTYADGNWGSYTQLAQENSVSCGFKPAGTVLGEACAGPSSPGYLQYDLLELVSTGTFDPNTGNFNYTTRLKQRNSPTCGYVTNGTVTFTSNATNVNINIPGKGNYNLGSYSGFIGGTYSYTATSPGYQSKSGSFVVSSNNTTVNINLTQLPNTTAFIFDTVPPLAKVFKVNQDGTETPQGFTNTGAALVVAAGVHTFKFYKHGYETLTKTFTATSGQVISDTSVLTPLLDRDEDDRYTLVTLNPSNYRPEDFSALKDAFDISVSKTFNGIGSLSFTVPYTVSDLLAVLDTDSGLAQVLVLLNGRPFFQAVIENYSPEGEGFTRVDAAEVLNLLTEDIYEGTRETTNLFSEYKPSSSGISDSASDAERAAFWGKNGSRQGYFYSYPESNKFSESGNGIVSGFDNGGYLVNRALNNNRVNEFICVVGKSGRLLSYFYYLGSETSGTAEASGLRVQITPFGSMLFEQGSTGTWTSVGSLPAMSDIQIGNTTVPITDALENGDVEYRFTYKVTDTDIKITASVRLTYAGVVRENKSPELSVPLSVLDPSYVDQAMLNLGPGEGIRYYYLEKTEKETLFDWLNQVAPQIRWTLASTSDSPMNRTATRLSFTDADTWQFVEKILQLAGNISLEYVGVVEGKPAYVIHDYEALTVVRKFYEGDELYEVSYDLDLSDTYNVLIATAVLDNEGETIKTTTNLRIAIQPDETKLAAWLGRKKKKLVKASGIKDIATLTQWAYSLYEENSEPSEAISFKAKLSAEWQSIILGQYIEVFGLPEGRKVREQITNITYDEATSEVAVELAKRVTLASAILEARNSTNIN